AQEQLWQGAENKLAGTCRAARRRRTASVNLQTEPGSIPMRAPEKWEVVMKRRTFLKSGAAASGAFVMGAPSLALASTSLKFDSYVSETAGPSWIDRWYLDELEKRTEGEVTIRRYWSGSLNKVGEHL